MLPKLVVWPASTVLKLSLFPELGTPYSPTKMGLPGARALKLEQPWHTGERMLQKKQGTVHTSDEMGPRIYHKVIPESYRDMVGPQPHFMVSFFDPETNASWSSLVFAHPGFADCETSNGTHIDIAAALDPRDAAARLHTKLITTNY